ncbi:MAG TPA: A24 family peptidase [Nocardioidaceae bacterium]|nr:A24 family peptidase [Nocardioidaceae bacterium]
MSIDGWYPVVGAVMAAVGALLGWFVPALVARIPEPEPDAEPPAQEVGAAGGETGRRAEAGEAADPEEQAPTAEPEDPKELYVDLAAHPGLAQKSALASALAAGVVGARLGWDPALLVWAYLVPVGVALAFIDWRTRLLPTKVIAPSYAVVVALTLVAALVSGDWDSLIRAGWGWLIAGATFFVLWFVYPRGMGYGDVRLSGLLGISLGYLGWAELLTGIYAGFLIGGVGGLLLSLLRIVDRKAYPFGPFMLVGALVGVLAGPYVAAWYA